LPRALSIGLAATSLLALPAWGV